MVESSFPNPSSPYQMEQSLKIYLFNKLLSVDFGPLLPCYHPFVGGKRENFKRTPPHPSAGAQSPDTISSLGFSKLRFS